MENGWVKIYRKIRYKGFYKRSAYVHLWLHLLLSANHKQEEFMWNGGLIMVREGQFIAGRKKLSEETGIPQTTIERILDFLESEHQIGQQKSSKYRLITIVNWKDFQKVDRKSDNKRTTSGHKQEVKEVKEEDIAEQSPAKEFSLKEEIETLMKSERRDLRLIGWFIKQKRIPLKSKEQLSVTIKRHLRPAKQLTPFSVKDLQWAQDEAERQIGNKWTLETILKLLTK